MMYNPFASQHVVFGWQWNRQQQWLGVAVARLLPPLLEPPFYPLPFPAGPATRLLHAAVWSDREQRRLKTEKRIGRGGGSGGCGLWLRSDVWFSNCSEETFSLTFNEPNNNICFTNLNIVSVINSKFWKVMAFRFGGSGFRYWCKFSYWFEDFLVIFKLYFFN